MPPKNGGWGEGWAHPLGIDQAINTMNTLILPSTLALTLASTQFFHRILLEKHGKLRFEVFSF